MYKENLEMLQGMFPGRALISLPQAAKAIGCKPDSLRIDPHLTKMKYGKQERVTLTALARYISYER